MIFERPYTVFTNGGHVGKNWCQVMEARLCKINKNCKSRLSVNLRVFSTDSTLNNFVRTFFKYNYVGSLQPLMFSTDILFSIKRDAYMFKETDDFVGFRIIRSSISGRWLPKSGKHVGPDFTLKPSPKASSLQFCKTEMKTDIGGKKKKK